MGHFPCSFAIGSGVSPFSGGFSSQVSFLSMKPACSRFCIGLVGWHCCYLQETKESFLVLWGCRGAVACACPPEASRPVSQLCWLSPCGHTGRKLQGPALIVLWTERKLMRWYLCISNNTLFYSFQAKVFKAGNVTRIIPLIPWWFSLIRLQLVFCLCVCVCDRWEGGECVRVCVEGCG